MFAFLTSFVLLKIQAQSAKARQCRQESPTQLYLHHTVAQLPRAHAQTHANVEECWERWDVCGLLEAILTVLWRSVKVTFCGSVPTFGSAVCLPHCRLLESCSLLQAKRGPVIKRGEELTTRVDRIALLLFIWRCSEVQARGCRRDDNHRALMEWA